MLDYFSGPDLLKQTSYDNKQSKPGRWHIRGPTVALNLKGSNNCPITIPEFALKINTNKGRLCCIFEGDVLTRDSHVCLTFYIDRLPWDFYSSPDLADNNDGLSFQFISHSWSHMCFTRVVRVDEGEHTICLKYSNTRDTLLDRGQIRIIYIQDTYF